MKIEQISEQGNDLETLKALRRKIARTLDETTSGRDIAALSRQLQIVLQQINELEAAQEIDADTAEIDEMIRGRQAIRDEKGRRL